MEPEEFMDLFGDDIRGIIADELKKLGLNEKQIKETWDMVLVALELPEHRQIFDECWKGIREAVRYADSWEVFIGGLLPFIWLYAMATKGCPKKVERNEKEIAEFTDKVMDRIFEIVEMGA